MLVSAVIPCHNSEAWLGLAIESLIAQTVGEVEIIVVDDSSSDGSAQVVRGFGDRVKLLSGKWGNGNHARNEGLKETTGEWVQFLDADDFLKPDKISSQLNGASSGADMIHSPLIVREEGAEAIETVTRPTAGIDLVEQWLRWEVCQTGAALWRTEALRRIGGWKEGLPCCQDNEVVLRALQNELRIEYVDHPGAVYRIWSEETVCRKDPKKVIRQKTELLDACIEWLEREGRMLESYREAAAQGCFEMARTWAKLDLAGAAQYFSARRKLGMIKLSGPAAPKLYRLVEKWAGFELTERLAALRR